MREQVRSGGRRVRVGLAVVTVGLMGLAVTGGPAFAGFIGQAGGQASPAPSGAAQPSMRPAPGASAGASRAPKVQRADGSASAPGARAKSAAPSGGDTSAAGVKSGGGAAGAKSGGGAAKSGPAGRQSAAAHGPLDADGNPADAIVVDGGTPSPSAAPDPSAQPNPNAAPSASGTSPADTGATTGRAAATADPTGPGAAASDEPADAAPDDGVADVGAVGVLAVPEAPGQVVAVPVPGGLRVTWTHDGSGVDHYVATAYGQDGALAGSCLGARADVSSCEIGIGGDGGAYTVRVVAYGGAGGADPSSPATSSVVVAGAPGAATGVHATVTSPTSVTVVWTAPGTPVAAIDHYEVVAVQDATKGCVTGNGATTWCAVTGLEAGVQYQFRVVTKGAGTATSAASAPVTVGAPRVQSAAPPEPVDLVVEAGDQKLLVEWRAPWDPQGVVGGYTVHVEEEPGMDCVTVERHCTISGLANGSTYTVRVRSDGAGAASGWVTAVGTPSVAPGEPMAVSAVARIEAVVVSWVAGSAGSGVAKFQALASAPGGDQGVCETVDANTCTIIGLKWGDTYTVTVKAIGRYGRNSAWSAAATAATPEAVTVPAHLPAGAGHFGGSSGEEVAPGERFTVSGTGFAPHSTVKVALYSTPFVLATTMTDGNGTFSTEVSVPERIAGGAHTLVAAGIDGAGEPRYLTMAVTVAVEYAVTAFGDAGAGVLAVTGGPVRSIAGAGVGMLFAGLLLIGVSRRPSVDAGTH